MTLQARLDSFKADFRSGKPPFNAPSEIHPVMERATAELIASGAAARALKVGDRAPAFMLNDPDGSPVSSADLLAKGPLVVSFYRGVWCPYCNMELQALEKARPAIEAAGASLIAISPQKPANSRRSARENSLGFSILSDPGNAVAAAFGLRFALPDYLVDLYKKLGNNLPLTNGDDSWTLPMPGRFAISHDGTVLYAEVNPDYTQRPEPDDLLPVASVHRRAGGMISMARTILITGATKGIGRATADRLAAAGHQVVGIARAVTPQFPGELIKLDLADAGATQEALANLVGRRDIDAVVNNVGLVRPQPIGAVTLDALSAVLDLNLRAAIQTVQAALPGMKARGWGRIVNISSLTVLGIAERTAYAAAKAGLISFTRGWALELARDGITVNAVAPGPTETELFRAGNPPGSVGEARYLSAVPMGRFGQPDEIAAAIAFLLSDDAAFITGQTLFVDGGASVGRALP